MLRVQAMFALVKAGSDQTRHQNVVALVTVRESRGRSRNVRHGAMQVLDRDPTHVRRTDTELFNHHIYGVVGIGWLALGIASLEIP